MNVIGKQRQVPVRRRDKRSKKLMVVTDADGNVATKMVQDEVWRETQNELGGHYGPDKHRKLVVGLCAGDVLMLYPKGTRQAVSVELKAVYMWCLQNKAMRRQLEKARETKVRKQAQRERRRLDAAERRLRKPIQ
jgi:hypothetical protein